MPSSLMVDEVFGVELLSHDATAGVEAVQLRQWSQHKAALILLEAGRKGDSGNGAGAHVEIKQEPHARSRSVARQPIILGRMI